MTQLEGVVLLLKAVVWVMEALIFIFSVFHT